MTRRFVRFSPLVLAIACNAILGIDEAGPIEGNAADAGLGGSSGAGGSGGTSGADSGLGGSAGSGGGVGGTGGVTDSGTCDANVATDSENCGACGHSCHGDPCVGGQCQPTLVRQFPFRLYYLTLSAGEIFASASGESAIVRVPKANHAGAEIWSPTTAGEDGFGQVGVFGTHAYFSHYPSQKIYRSDLSSIQNPLEVIQGVTSYPGDVLVDATGIYWDSCGDGLWHATGPGASEQKLLFSPSCVYRFRIDGDTIWATSASDGKLYRAPKGGGTIADFSVTPAAQKTYALAISPAHVFLATFDDTAGTAQYDSRLYRIDKNAPSGTSPEMLQGGKIFPSIEDMTVDDGFLYLVESGTTQASYGDGRVVRVPLTDPNATPEVIADNRKYPVAIAIDSEFIYWIDEIDPGFSPAEIWRRAK